MNSLGILYTVTNRAAEAEPLLKKCLIWKKQNLGDYDERTLHTMEMLGVTYKTMGPAYYSKALTIFTECYENKVKTLGENHVSSLDALSRMADMHLTKGDYANAITLFKKYLQKASLIFGTEHENIKSVSDDLAKATVMLVMLKSAK